ncbi:MAG TPA: helix-turn-helix transcriptional regulator [Anaeromyxobacter sp.]|nr:helix-turn-helix transcriptional regulator [Anaeromyxobacter sp.]
MKPLAQQNLYEILDVPFDANSATIAEAVERAQALYAPGSLATYTLMDPEEEQLLVRLLEEARATLLDPDARARYDERITGPETAVPQPAPAPAPPLDPAIRAVWPELPPVFGPAVPPGGAHGEDEDEEEWEDVPDVPAPPPPPATRPAPPVIPAAQLAQPPAPPPEPPPAVTAPPVGQRPPILLSREVAPPPAERPAATPAPITTPIPTAPPVVATAPADGTTWSGEVLRQIREARGISLQQISERTKVTRHHIENIEADRFELLPAAVYLRGILLSISRELRLDGQKVARSYLERVTAATAPTAPVPRPR